MVDHHDNYFTWFKRMAWVKTTLFYGFYCTGHPSRSKAHLETQLHKSLLKDPSSKDLSFSEMQLC